MSLPLPKIFTFLFFAFCLVFSGIMLTQLKQWPQIAIIILAATTLLSWFGNREIIFSIMFVILLWIIAVAAFYNCSVEIIQYFNPPKPFDFPGSDEAYPMTYNWVWALGIGIIIPPVLLLIYNNSGARNRMIEFGFTLIFLLMAGTIFLVNEVF